MTPPTNSAPPDALAPPQDDGPSGNQSGRRDRVGVSLIILSAIAFSAKAIFVKLAYADTAGAAARIDPVTLLTMRMLLALPFFAVIAWWSSRGARLLDMRDWRTMVVIGLMGYYGASLLDFWGLLYISAALERLILFLNPTLVVLISAFALGYRIVRRDVFALVASYAGIALVFAHDLSFNPGKVWLGSSLVLLSALLYAGYLVGAGQMIKRVGATRFAAYASIISTVAITLHFFITRELTALTGQSSQVWKLAGWMAVVSTVLPVVMMAEGMRRVGSSNAAMMGSIGPIATIFMGAIFLGEPITGVQLAGATLVMAGVLAISLKKAKP
ncbi:MAG: DMT family transporter [Roseiflexaceae bacterium]|nr:DMT family transporter [Roseiflexaceae bacterium]